MHKRIALYLLLIGLPASAMAAPFCVEIRGIRPACDYVDAAQCRIRANQLSAVCIINKAEFSIPQGIGKFCVVDSSRMAECLYSDRNSCEDEAMRKNAVCVDNSPVAEQQDPHQSNPDRSY